MLRTSRRLFRRPSFEAVAVLEVRIVLAAAESPVDSDEAESQDKATRAEQRQEERQERREERQLRREERRPDLAGSTPSSEPEVLEDDPEASDQENEDGAPGPVDGVRPRIDRSQRDAAIVSVVDPQAFQESLPASPPEVTVPVEATLPERPVEILGFIVEDSEQDDSLPTDAPPVPPEPMPTAPPVQIPPLDELPRPAEIPESVPDVARIPQAESDRPSTPPRPMPPALVPLPGPLGNMPVEVSGLLDDLFEVFFDWFADPEAN